jgi:hypothetical protein
MRQARRSQKKASGNSARNSIHVRATLMSKPCHAGSVRSIEQARIRRFQGTADPEKRPAGMAGGAHD